MFFGLVEQVSWAFLKTEDMAPFRKLLSPQEKYLWTSDFDAKFKRVRNNIIEKVKEGVLCYDLNCVTVLNTDWSRTGMSGAVLQKYCSCMKIKLSCCHED